MTVTSRCRAGTLKLSPILVRRTLMLRAFHNYINSSALLFSGELGNFSSNLAHAFPSTIYQCWVHCPKESNKVQSFVLWNLKVALYSFHYGRVNYWFCSSFCSMSKKTNNVSRLDSSRHPNAEFTLLSLRFHVSNYFEIQLCKRFLWLILFILFRPINSIKHFTKVSEIIPLKSPFDRKK